MNVFLEEGGAPRICDPAAKLNHPGVIEYFTGNPHRMAALRAMLDLFVIPAPDWAKRDLSGRGAASRNLMAAFKADNPKALNYTLAPRKENVPSRDVPFLG